MIPKIYLPLVLFRSLNLTVEWIDVDPCLSMLSFSKESRDCARKRFPDNSNIDLFDDKDFTVNCSEVNLADEIARGSYGVVYKGILPL